MDKIQRLSYQLRWHGLQPKSPEFARANEGDELDLDERRGLQASK